MTSRTRLVYLMLMSWYTRICLAGDFEFIDFSDSTGVVFLNSASTSSCESEVEGDRDFAYGYQQRHGGADTNNETTVRTVKETGDSIEITGQQTARDGDFDSTMDAVLGHRENVKVNDTWSEPGKCPIRLRLTPSEPFKRGAVWFSDPMNVHSGFETGFTFQVTSQSTSSTTVRDNSFGVRQYESRRVHGGDGFAFVLNCHHSGIDAQGTDGSGLGYHGLSNSLVVEFDTWYNPELGDLVSDHISVQAAGPNAVCDSSLASSLHSPVAANLADGNVHEVRIAYYPELRSELSASFSILPRATQFLVENDPDESIGTLAIWIDQFEKPLISLPINLESAIDLAEGSAFVGFTSSTGSSWEKHDIISWYFCENPSGACSRSGL